MPSFSPEHHIPKVLQHPYTALSPADSPDQLRSLPAIPSPVQPPTAPTLGGSRMVRAP